MTASSDAAKVMLKLAVLRKNRGMSQHALAQRMGVHKEEVSRWESGQREPQLSSVLRYMRAIGVRLSYEVLFTADPAEPGDAT